MNTFKAIQVALQNDKGPKQVQKHSGDLTTYAEEELNPFKFLFRQNEQGTQTEQVEQKQEEYIIPIEQFQSDTGEPEKNEENISQSSSEVKSKECKQSNLLSQIKSMNSFAIDDNYFKEDVDEKVENKRTVQDISKVKDFFMKFRLGQFIEFFLIHFLYFFLLGPFLLPFLRMRGKYLSQNLLFEGWHIQAFGQFCIYLINITCIIFSLAFYNPNVTLEIEFLNNIQSVVARCVIIAIKYATFDPIKIEIIRSIRLPVNIIVSDFILSDWFEQNSKIVIEQIHYASRYHDIDPGLFFVQFIVDPEEQTKQRLQKVEKAVMQQKLENNVCKKPISVAKAKGNEVIYFGCSVIIDIIQLFEKRYKYRKYLLKYFSHSFAFTRAIIPIFYRYFTYGIQAYESWHELYIALASAIQIFTLYRLGLQIGLHGIVDLCRKLEMLRQITYMIAPRKGKGGGTKKLYPTINIFRSINLKGWSLLRKVCMEYGKPYFIRIQAFFVFLGILVCGNLVQLILFQYKIIDQNVAQLIQNYLDAVAVLICVFAMLFIGAKINKLFDHQENILNSNKTIVTDLLLIGTKYVSNQKKSQSFIYNKALQKILEESEEDFYFHVQSLTNYYDNHIQELIYDSKQNALTFYGIKASYVFLKSVIVAVGSVFITLVTSFIKNN